MRNREESIDLLKQGIPIRVKGEKWIIEVPLKDTVGTIHRAIGNGIDHIVSTTDMIGSPWTGFQTSSIKMGEEEMFLPDPDRIGHRKKMFHQRPLVLNPFDRNIG
jgi:hypothetical protein